jgi:ADP-ribose pyrophosphatase YjhB (NUDIX family)
MPQKPIDFASVAYIVHKNKVAFVKHKELKRWLPVGGHIGPEEDPEEALFKKIKQETGLSKNQLTILSKKPNFKSDEQKYLYTPNLLDIHKIGENHKHIGIIFFIKSKTKKLKTYDKGHDDIKWLSKADLHNPFYNLRPDMIYAAEKALELEKSFK